MFTRKHWKSWKTWIPAILLFLLLAAGFGGFTANGGPGASTRNVAHATSAEAVNAQFTGPHISFSPSRVDDSPVLKVKLTGRGFPADDVETIDVVIDGLDSGLLPNDSTDTPCSNVTWSDPTVNNDGNWSITVELDGCWAHDNIAASVSDDHHLNHAQLTIN